jgi:hypothetical protein
MREGGRMGKREGMLEVINRAYDARRGSDLDGLMSGFHPDVVFTLVGDKSSLAVVGTARDHRELRETLRGFIATFDFATREILSEIVEETALLCTLASSFVIAQWGKLGRPMFSTC